MDADCAIFSSRLCAPERQNCDETCRRANHLALAGLRCNQSRLAAMSDEFTAEHTQIGIGFISMCDVAVRTIFGIGLSVEGISRGVNPNKAKTVTNSI